MLESPWVLDENENFSTPIQTTERIRITSESLGRNVLNKHPNFILLNDILETK